MRRFCTMRPRLAVMMAACAWALATHAFGQEKPLLASIQASPRLDRSSIGAGGLTARDGKAEFTSRSLADLVCAAYKIGPHQLSGPAWMKAQFWNIQFSIQGSNATPSELLRTVLEQRFKLEVHRETKEQDVYALVQSPDGHRLQEAEPDFNEGVPNAAAGAPSPPPDERSMPMLWLLDPDTGLARRGREYWPVDMATFAVMLSQSFDRPVIDDTGLRGEYCVTAEVLSETSLASVARFKAHEKMGLNLIYRTMAIDLIVVDHIEEIPTKN